MANYMLVSKLPDDIMTCCICETVCRVSSNGFLPFPLPLDHAQQFTLHNSMQAIPTIRGFCEHIGVSTGLVGVIAGASDFASMFMTPGLLSPSHSPGGCCALPYVHKPGLAGCLFTSLRFVTLSRAYMLLVVFLLMADPAVHGSC